MAVALKSAVWSLKNCTIFSPFHLIFWSDDSNLQVNDKTKQKCKIVNATQK